MITQIEEGHTIFYHGLEHESSKTDASKLPAAFQIMFFESGNFVADLEINYNFQNVIRRILTSLPRTSSRESSNHLRENVFHSAVFSQWLS
jgi:hypothetical protein